MQLEWHSQNCPPLISHIPDRLVIHLVVVWMRSIPMAIKYIRKYLNKFRTELVIKFHIFLFLLPNLLNPMQHTAITSNDVRYNFRRPNFFTVIKKNMPPTMPTPLANTLTMFAFIGAPSALNTWMLYGSKTTDPLNLKQMCKHAMKISGRIFRRRLISLILSQMVGRSW